jgi:rhodanese-related sulfurtransferase
MNSSAPQVDVGELALRVAGGAPLIDVREPDEYAEVHATGARLVPLGTVVESFDVLQRELAAGQPWFVICRSGGRSLRATTWLREQGVDAVNVAGGTDAWVAAGLPTASGPAGS